MRLNLSRVCTVIFVCMTTLCCAAADRILLTRLGPSEASLFVSNADGSGERGLTHGTRDYNPAWSPAGKWIAFSSDRESSLPMAKGRWEHLHLVDIYIVRPDGSGLKRLSRHGDFCGSPKWAGDSKSVVTYCMPAEDTWTYRVNVVEGETTLTRSDGASGDAKPMSVGPGIKIFSSVLPSGEIACVRRDTRAQGVFYEGGK